MSSELGEVIYASAEEERRWNSFSQRMMTFHQYFKDEFKMIYESTPKSADGSFSKRGLSLPRYLDTITFFNSHLTMHHTIEERFVFPILAKRIPKFAHDTEGGHVGSHKAIHDGLESLTRYVLKWRRDPTSYSPTEMKICLDNLSDVLFEHLDQEVEDIRGEKLKPYFTLDEIERIGH